MDTKEAIKQAREHIMQAIEDYSAFVDSGYVLRDMTYDFVNQLARDSIRTKQKLRELFSKSPNWNPELDAIIIDGEKTHDTDYKRLSSLINRLVDPALETADKNKKDLILQAKKLFLEPVSEETKDQSIKAINTLAPKAYAPGKKLSRVLKAFCVSLGLADETKGSEFQKLYAQAADEMNAKPINFKLFMSINPAHFLTMSNPKGDARGETLISCHSLNDTTYGYNCGCTGYARDETSFIVFTVDDPDNAESFNNRKTTRQIFAYTPGNGVLLQSRMYNTSGGVCGAAEESRVYRNIVQHEISALENVPNLWKTGQATSSKYKGAVLQHPEFGGYADWECKEFDTHISIRTDHTNNWQPIVVGNAGLCICCGAEINNGLYCENHTPESHRCPDCGRIIDGELYRAYDKESNEVWVCSECLERNYTFCSYCEEFFPEDLVTYTEDEENVCDECLKSYYRQCECCNTWHKPEEVIQIRGRYDREIYSCVDCVDEIATGCDECGEAIYKGMTVEAYKEDGTAVQICEDCARSHFTVCPDCGNLVKMTDEDVCPYCGVCHSSAVA